MAWRHVGMHGRIAAITGFTVTIAFAFGMMTPTFGTNDDAVNILALTGGHMYPASHVPISPTMHLPFSCVLSWLYLRVDLPWYSILLYAQVLITWIIFAELMRKHFEGRDWWAFVLLSSGIFFWLFIRPQFTTVASVTAFATTIGFVSIGNSNRRISNVKAIALLGFTLACLYRPTSAILGFLLGVAASPAFNNPNEMWLKLRTLASVFPLLITVIIGTNHLAVESSSIAKEFDQRRALISALKDYKVLTNSRNQILDEKALTANDIALFESWFAFDEERFSNSQLQAFLDDYGYKNNFVLARAKSFFRLHSPRVAMVTFVIVLALVMARLASSWSLIGIGLPGVLVIAINLFFTLIGRPPPWRVDFAMCIILIVVATVLIAGCSRFAKSFLAIGILAIWSYVFVGLGVVDYENNSATKNREFKIDAESLPISNRHTVFGIYADTFNLQHYILPFRDTELIEGLSLFWIAIPGHHPDAVRMMRDKGIENFFLELPEKDNLYLIAEEQEVRFLQIYYQEIGYGHVSFATEYEGELWSVWSASSD